MNPTPYLLPRVSDSLIDREGGDVPEEDFGSVGITLCELHVVRKAPLHQLERVLRCLLEDVRVRRHRRTRRSILERRSEGLEDVLAQPRVDVEFSLRSGEEEGREDEGDLIDKGEWSAFWELSLGSREHGSEVGEAEGGEPRRLGFRQDAAGIHVDCARSVRVLLHGSSLEDGREGRGGGREGFIAVDSSCSETNLVVVLLPRLANLDSIQRRRTAHGDGAWARHLLPPRRLLVLSQDARGRANRGGGGAEVVVALGGRGGQGPVGSWQGLEALAVVAVPDGELKTGSSVC